MTAICIPHNKLGRDKTPDTVKEHGCEFVGYVCDKQEYARRLRLKLREEVEEFLADDTLVELADIIEVIRALAVQKGSSIEEVEKLRAEKEERRGGFYKGVMCKEIIHRSPACRPK